MEIEEILEGIRKINEARKFIRIVYRVDEQDRIIGFQAQNQKYREGIDKSHTHSYLEQRRIFQEEFGDIMGFDQDPKTGAEK